MHSTKQYVPLLLSCVWFLFVCLSRCGVSPLVESFYVDSIFVQEYAVNYYKQTKKVEMHVKCYIDYAMYDDPNNNKFKCICILKQD